MQSKTTTHQHTPKFIKLFPELPPLHVSDEKLGQLAVQMKDGMCNKPENYSQFISNGMAIFSQFLAHDMTFESSSQLKGQSNDISQFQNDRSINLDLDCIYGQKTQSFF